MDLSVQIANTKLNIRVSLILETPKGYIFEHEKLGYYCTVGGRIKTNETSIEAANRELEEELGVKINNISYRATIENFFEEKGTNYHEINIIHTANIEENIQLPENFKFIEKGELRDMDIRPKAILDLIENQELKHLIDKA